MRVPPEAARQPPTVLVKWYDWLRWLLDRVDSFPKNQRFIFGTRLADRAIGLLELLVEAAYSSEKQHLLAQGNRDNHDNPDWKHCYLHPQDTHGALIQVFEETARTLAGGDEQ